VPRSMGILGNEKADEWAEVAAAEPDTRGVEWLRHANLYGKRPMPPPRSLAHLKREIAKKKWTEARRWAQARVTGRKYKLPSKRCPDAMVARSTKGQASRYYQLIPGHALIGQYLKGTNNRPSAECGWCGYKAQTREHLFKRCPRLRPQQKILWAETRKETGRGEDRFKIRDLFADERSSKSILYFLSTPCVGRRIPEPAGEEAQSESSGRSGEVDGGGTDLGAGGVEGAVSFSFPLFYVFGGDPASSPAAGFDPLLRDLPLKVREESGERHRSCSYLVRVPQPFHSMCGRLVRRELGPPDLDDNARPGPPQRSDLFPGLDFGTMLVRRQIHTYICR
jgi:hypothetical protein